MCLGVYLAGIARSGNRVCAFEYLFLLALLVQLLRGPATRRSNPSRIYRNGIISRLLPDGRHGVWKINTESPRRRKLSVSVRRSQKGPKPKAGKGDARLLQGDTWMRWWHFHLAHRNPSQPAAFPALRLCVLLADSGLLPSSTATAAERDRELGASWSEPQVGVTASVTLRAQVPWVTKGTLAAV